MQIDAFAEPRRFPVGEAEIQLSHVANIDLQPDEMVTFISDGGREYDVTAKDWGYYATPSVGGRLRHFGMRAALMRNVDTRQVFVVLVFDDQVPAWRGYMKDERQELVMWLDDVEAVFVNTAPAHDGSESA
jgi:hypothetical protein